MAVRLEREPRIRVSTPKGSVRARHVVLAGDALLRGWSRASTAASCRSATTSSPPSRLEGQTQRHPGQCRGVRHPLRRQLLPDVGGRTPAVRRRRALHADRRRPTSPAFVRPHMEETFPQLQGLPHRPCLGRAGVGDDVAAAACRALSARSISRMAIPARASILSTLSGKLLAEAITGETSRLDLFSTLSPMPFPGRRGAARPALCARLRGPRRDRTKH